MIPRLTVCFGLSVLLHGLFLLSILPTFRPGGNGYAQRNHAMPGRLTVFIEAENGKEKSTVSTSKPGKKPAVDVPARPLVKQIPEFSPPPPGLPLPIFAGSGLPAPPGTEAQRQMQMNYRQMYEMQARQQALQQNQMFIVRLQADIEQSINLHEDSASGECAWHETTATLQCESKALDRRMHAETERLSALRNAMKVQGAILDGFTVSISGDRTAITYHAHTANSDPAP
jgi:hypothetical protein